MSALVSVASAITCLIILWRVRIHAHHIAEDRRDTAAAAEAATAAANGNPIGLISETSEVDSIPVGAMAPTIPIDLAAARAARERKC
ncbi:hypothetical protein IRT45_36030 [Nocardia sp. BSTN01]|uniref:hypothetical protein n=1 Tax=Nocardia sp. BSTN01 TaxID=2783665 RepID=UPI00188FAF54|nr:hypothetical protein [Nocardia sp. BSTN01]MBF5002525.1 hypothetical protein [Nocardia sp. BSTN01]